MEPSYGTMNAPIRMLLVVGMVSNAALVSAEAPASQRSWLNPPKTWSDKDGRITIAAEPKSDFWRLTGAGAVADSGHFYFEEREGDFTVTVKFQGEYAAQYDQAGLMLRIDEKNWIKTGVEFLDGRENIATVITRDFSDGSVVHPQEAVAKDGAKSTAKPVWMKLARKGDFIEIHYSRDNRTFEVVRQGHFPPKVACKVGVMAAAPLGAGFKTVFEDFEITAAK
jgi:uncharacterized protein